MNFRNHPCFWIAILLLPVYCCEREPVDQDRFPAEEFIKSGTYLGEYYPTQQWRECAPSEVGMDEEHLKAMNEMKDLMQSPEAMNEWTENKRREFKALPENE